MKRMLTLAVLLLLIFVIPMGAAAADNTCGQSITWSLDASGVLTLTGTGDMYHYAPGEAPWYAQRYSVKTVVLTEGITGVGSNAFGGCGNLSAVTLPSTVKNIGIGAFSSCLKLSAITLPQALESIGADAFIQCKALPAVTVGPLVNQIGSNAFNGCAALTAITVDAANTAYASDASGVLFNKAMTTLLQAPGKLTGSYTIPASTTAISNNAFYMCARVTRIQIPASVSSIGSQAFTGCIRLGKIQVEEGNTQYTSDAKGVLYNKAMTCLLQAPAALSDAYAITDGVREIEDFAFFLCEQLPQITLPNSLQTIGESAFSGCIALKNFAFNGGAPVIEADAMKSVTAAVTYPAGNTTWTSQKQANYGGKLTWQSVTCVTGSVTAPEGVPVEISLQQNGVTLQSVQAANGYSFHNVEDGSYTLTFAGKDMPVASCEIVVSGGAAVQDIVAYTQDALVEIKNALELEGAIGVHYYLHLAEGVTDPVVHMWMAEGEKTLYPAQILKDGRYAYKYDIYAMEMADTIFTEIVLQKDGITYTLPIYEYSAVAYGKKALGSDTTSAQLKALIAALLRYGGYAQRHFEYHTDNLAYAILPTYNFSIAPDATQVNRSQRIDGTDFAGDVLASFTGNALELNAKIAIRFGFTLDASVNPQNVYMAYRERGSEGDYTYVKAARNGDNYFGRIENIGSYAYSTYFDAFICVKEADGYTQISQERSFSAECYATTAMNQVDPKYDLLRDCMITMITYGNLSKQMFG